MSSTRWRNSFDRTPGIAIFMSGFTLRKNSLSTAPLLPCVGQELGECVESVYLFVSSGTAVFPAGALFWTWSRGANHSKDHCGDDDL